MLVKHNFVILFIVMSIWFLKPLKIAASPQTIDTCTIFPYMCPEERNFCEWFPTMCNELWINCLNESNSCQGDFDGKCCMFQAASQKWYLVLSIVNSSMSPRQINDFLRTLIQKTNNNLSFVYVVDYCSSCVSSFTLEERKLQIPSEICQLSTSLDYLLLGYGLMSIDNLCFENMKNLRLLVLGTGTGRIRISIPLSKLLHNLTSLEFFHFNHYSPGPCEYYQPSGALFTYSKQLKFIEMFSINTQPQFPKSIFQGLVNIREIHVHSSVINYLPEDLFRGLKTLEIIDFSYNNIVYLPSQLFHDLLSLKTVDFQSNQIIQLDMGLFLPLLDLPTLRLINFARNSITTLSDWPSRFTAASSNIIIDLSFNAIIRSNHSSNDTLISPRTSARPTYIDLRGHSLLQLQDIVTGLGFTDPSSRAERTLFITIANVHSLFMCDCQDVTYFTKVRRMHFIDVSSMYCIPPSTVNSIMIMNRQSSFTLCEIPPPECAVDFHCRINLNTNVMLVTSTTSAFANGELPQTIPSLPQFNNGSWRNFNFSYHIDFSNNNLTILQARNYFTQIKVIDLSFNKIFSIDQESGYFLSTASIILLNDNKLVSLPKTMANIKRNSLLQEIHLYNNPWSCDCESSWMKPWLESLGNKVVKPSSIICHNKDARNMKPLLELEDELFQCHYILSTFEYVALTVGFTCFCCFFVIISIFAFTYKYRHWLFIKYDLHPFEIDECVGESVDYDLFLSYANEDEQFVEQFVNKLENDHLFIVCYHRRDFCAGVPSLENMERAVTRSKRTVCYLTANYLKSEWCMWEFMMALNLDLEYKRHRLIVVKHESLSINAISNLSARAHLAHYTYVELGSPYFLQQLLYSLPQQKLCKQVVTNKQTCGSKQDTVNLLSVVY